MKAIKITVNLQHINSHTVNKKLYEFYTLEEPSKDFIKNKTEEILGLSLIIKDYSPDKGRNYGAFFYCGDMYITYHFKRIEILE